MTAKTKNRKHEPVYVSDIVLADPERPTADELIRIAQNLADNQKYKRVTRDGFRQATQISDKHWAAHFGSFPSFMEAAGLNTSAQARKVANQIARHARQDYIRQVSHERLSWDKNFEKPNDGARWKSIMACSDIHDVEGDPFAKRMFVQKCADAQPDIVCIDGDLFDLAEFGRHPKDPREWDVATRVNSGLEFIAQIRLAAPNAQIDLIEGNHEARLIKFLMSDAPAAMSLLHDVHGMDVRKLLRLDEYEVNYVSRGDLGAFTDAQLRKGVLSSEQVYYGFVLARHHPVARKSPSAFPGFSGHHHKHEVQSLYNHRYGSFEWHQMGGMHKRQASYTYFHESDLKWNCGFLHADVDTHNERVMFDYTVVGDTGCRLHGDFFERQPDEFYPGLEAELTNYNRQPQMETLA